MELLAKPRAQSGPAPSRIDVEPLKDDQQHKKMNTATKVVDFLYYVVVLYELYSAYLVADLSRVVPAFCRPAVVRPPAYQSLRDLCYFSAVPPQSGLRLVDVCRYLGDDLDLDKLSSPPGPSASDCY